MEQAWLEIIAQAKEKKDAAEKELDEIVIMAARQGVSWVSIAKVLNLTRQGVRQKYIKDIKE